MTPSHALHPHWRLLATTLLLALPVLASAESANDDSNQRIQLEAVQVVGTRIDDGYRPAEVTGALGLPADPRDVPQSITTLTPELIDDTGATRMEDALDYASGISRQNEFGGVWDNYAIRGFEGDINRGPVFLRDGVRANRGFTSKQDAANVERLEILKGPASALYGRGEPGGTVNIVTKRPGFVPQGELALRGGSEGERRATADVTRPLSDDVSGRFNIAVEDSDTFRDEVEEERYLLAPALTWIINPDTRFGYDGELIRQDRTFDRGIPAIDNSFGDVPIDRFLGEPDDGDVRIDNLANRFRLQHDMTDIWSGQFTLTHLRSRLEGFSSEAFGASVEQQQAFGIPEGQLARDRRFRDFESDDFVGVVELRGRPDIGDVRHEVLFGLEASQFKQDFLQRRSNPLNDPYLIDVDNPQYGQEAPDFDPARRTDRRDSEETLALYAQDLIHLSDNTRLLVGARFDQFEQETRDRDSGAEQRQRDEAFSPRLGLSHDLNPNATIYASFADSFDSNAGTDRNGDQFRPQESRSLEVGFKGLVGDGRAGIDVAVFAIDKENVLTTDPQDPDFSVAAGEVQSRGIEVDLNGDLTDRWRMSLSYAFTDAKIQADGVDFTEDVSVRNVPRNSASLVTNYEFQTAQYQTIGLGGGVVYVGSRVGNQNQPEFELPSYVVAQARAYYRPSPDFDLSLRVHNLFDEEYYTSSFFQNWVAPGQPRTVTAELRYRF